MLKSRSFFSPTMWAIEFIFIKPQRHRDHRDHRESRRMGDKKYSVYLCALHVSVFKKYPTYHPIPELWPPISDLWPLLFASPSPPNTPPDTISAHVYGGGIGFVEFSKLWSFLICWCDFLPALRSTYTDVLRHCRGYWGNRPSDRWTMSRNVSGMYDPES